MKSAGTRNVAVARRLVLHFVRVLKVRFESGSNIMSALDPVHVSDEVLLGIGISLRLKRICRSKRGETVDGQFGKPALLQALLLGQARRGQTWNAQESESEVLILIRLVAKHVDSRIA